MILINLKLNLLNRINLLTRIDMNMEMNFEYFRIQKWMLQTVGVEKVDESFV